MSVDRHAVRADAPRLIGLAGNAGSGKTTGAGILCDQGFARARFAGPLKAMLWGLLNAAGRDTETINRMLEGDLKETPCGLLGGRTPRQAMQTLGTEWGRDMIAPDLWTRITMQGVRVALRSGGRVVIDDVRFASEAAAIRSEGGVIWHVLNEICDDNDDGNPVHPSEVIDFDCDAVVENPPCLDPDDLDALAACKDQFAANLLAHLLG